MTAKEFDNLKIGDTVERDMSAYRWENKRYIVAAIRKARVGPAKKVETEVVVVSEYDKDTRYIYKNQNAYRFRLIPMATLLDEIFGTKGR